MANVAPGSLKSAIFNEVRRQNPEMTMSDDELNQMMFHTRTSLRLTLTGFVELKAIFTAYSFSLPPTLKSRHRFGLSKIEFPYFFTKSRLILFSEMDAMVVELQGGVEEFLENCANIDT